MAEKKVAKMELPKKVLDLEQIIPYELNNKVHGEKKVNLLANMIDTYGFVDEIIVDKNNVIIAGHGRVEALKKMGYDSVEVKVLDIDIKDAKAFRILHNKINQFDTEDNMEAIKAELDEIAPDGIYEALDMSIAEVFPEFNAPEFNSDDYEDNTDTPGGKVSIVCFPENEDDIILLEQYLGENNIKYKKQG